MDLIHKSNGPISLCGQKGLVVFNWKGVTCRLCKNMRVKGRRQHA